MFLSFLVPFSKSIWWNFDDAEFPTYEQNSLRRPIFAICTSTYCPHCKGLPEMLQSYSNLMGNNTPIIFTNINCQKSTVCDKIGIRGVPSFVLIRGTKPSNWVQTYERNSIGWNKFLKSQLKAKINKIENESELKRLITNTYYGGSTFYLQINKNDNITKILNKYRKESIIYGAIHCTFAYKVVDSETKLTVFTSEHCSETFSVNSKNLGKTISENAYSKFAEIDSNDLYDYVHENKTVMVFVGEYRERNYRIKLIESASKDHCKDIVFGWANKEKEQQMVKLGKRRNEGLSFFFKINPKKDCFSYKNIENNANDLEEFIAMSNDNTQCMKVPVLRREGKKKPLKKVWIFLFIVFIVVLFGSYFVYQIFGEDTLKLE